MQNDMFFDAVMAEQRRKRTKRNLIFTLVVFAVVIGIGVVMVLIPSDDGGIARFAVGDTPPAPRVDRAGNAIELPPVVERAVSFGGAVTDIIAGLGAGDRLVGVCSGSGGICGLSGTHLVFDVAGIDGALVIGLQPDAVFVHESAGLDAYVLQLLDGAGITVVHMPASENMFDIRSDILFLANIFDRWFEGYVLVSELNDTFDALESFGGMVASGAIENPGSIFFAVNKPGHSHLNEGTEALMASFGSGVFLDEIISIIGGENIFSAYQGWLVVSDEQVVAGNPDVIITNRVGHDPIGEIKSRPGWGDLNAVRNGRVHFVDTGLSSRNSHNIMYGINDILNALFPLS